MAQHRRVRKGGHLWWLFSLLKHPRRWILPVSRSFGCKQTDQLLLFCCISSKWCSYVSFPTELSNLCSERWIMDHWNWTGKEGNQSVNSDKGQQWCSWCLVLCSVLGECADISCYRGGWREVSMCQRWVQPSGPSDEWHTTPHQLPLL